MEGNLFASMYKPFSESMNVSTYGALMATSIIEQYQSGKALGSPDFDALYPLKNYASAAEKLKLVDAGITPTTVAIADMHAGDIMFSCSTLFTASSIVGLKSSRKAYLYLFDYTASNPAMSLFGPAHTVDLAFTFGNFAEYPSIFGLPPWKPTAFELKLSRDMMDYWLNFARNGTPNADSTAAKWPVAGCGEKNNFMVFGKDGPGEDAC